ncbi:hypothetical protein EON71_00645 [bacterium]|nr:MAG: hypothetical protein EON71_00645 [bacterium]
MNKRLYQTKDTSDLSTEEKKKAKEKDIEYAFEQLETLLSEENKKDNASTELSYDTYGINITKKYIIDYLGKHTSTYHCKYDAEECRISNVLTKQYKTHTCVEINEKIICDYDTHIDPSITPVRIDRIFYVCLIHRTIHQCDQYCNSTFQDTNSDDQNVCRISGIVFDAITKNDWIPEKLDLTEPDQSNTVEPCTSIITKIEKTSDGSIIKHIYHVYKDILEPVSTRTGVNPYTYSYNYLNIRCKHILYKILFSKERKDAEKEHLLNVQRSMRKDMKYHVETNFKKGNFVYLDTLLDIEKHYDHPEYIWPETSDADNNLYVLSEIDIKITEVTQKIMDIYFCILCSTKYMDHDIYIVFDYVIVYLAHKFYTGYIKNNEYLITPDFKIIKDYFPRPEILSALGYKHTNMTIVNKFFIQCIEKSHMNINTIRLMVASYSKYNMMKNAYASKTSKDF